MLTSVCVLLAKLAYTHESLDGVPDDCHSLPLFLHYSFSRRIFVLNCVILPYYLLCEVKPQSIKTNRATMAAKLHVVTVPSTLREWFFSEGPLQRQEEATNVLPDLLFKKARRFPFIQTSSLPLFPSSDDRHQVLFEFVFSIIITKEGCGENGKLKLRGKENKELWLNSSPDSFISLSPEL